MENREFQQTTKLRSRRSGGINVGNNFSSTRIPKGISPLSDMTTSLQVEMNQRHHHLGTPDLLPHLSIL